MQSERLQGSDIDDGGFWTLTFYKSHFKPRDGAATLCFVQRPPKTYSRFTV